MDKLAEFLKRHPDISAAAIIFIVTALFFLPGLHFDPVPLDNAPYVGREYLLFPTWQNFLYHLKTPVLNLYSPLVMHSLMLDYAVWGRELLQTGGRLHNILLHCANAVMFYFLLRKLKLVRLNPAHPFSLSVPAAVFGALCFALHPQRVESVIWLAERKDVLALFFGLASTILFIRSYSKNRLPLAGTLLYFLSFGVKPLIITLPGVLFLGIWVCTEKFDWRKALKMLSPYLAAALIYIALNSVQLKDFAAGAASGGFDPARLQIVIFNYANYFFRTLVPLNIRPLYPLFHWDADNIFMVSAFFTITVATVFLALIKWRYRQLFIAFLLPLLLAFIGVVLPMAGFRVIGNAEFADRYSYYPSLFVWIGMAAALEYYYPQRFIAKFFFWAYGMFIAVLGICYLFTWQSRESFVNAAVGNGLDANPVALRMAAVICMENQNFDQALNYAAMMMKNDRYSRGKEGELFYLCVSGMAELARNNPAGLAKLDSALTDPQWGRFRFSSRGFAETVLLKSAEIHLQINTPQDVEFARNCYLVLGDLSMGTDPVKDLSYRAYAAYLGKDYQLAENLTAQALQISPQDQVLLEFFHYYRDLKLKNSPAKEASK